MENKNNANLGKRNLFRIRKPILIGAIVAIIGIFAIYFFMTGMTSNSVKDLKQAEENYASWLADNCKCFERNNTMCNYGYELKENVCVNQTLKTFTNTLKGCSKYECSGTNVTLNNQIWGPKINTNSSR